MKIDLDGLNIEDIVQQSVANAITKSLGASLPKVVESLITQRGSYGKENLIQEAFSAAVKASIEKNIAEFIEDRQPEIRRLVRMQMEQLLDPAAIADSVTSQLEGVKATLFPFRGAKKGKAGLPPVIDLDDE